jgi:hypothetical protein
MDDIKKDGKPCCSSDGGLTPHDEEDPNFFIKMGEHNFELNTPESSGPRVQDTAMVFTSCKWGNGDNGAELLQSLMVSLTQSPAVPKYIILMDCAVFLATEHCIVNCVASLQKLEQIGVKILLHQSSVKKHNQMAGIIVGEVVQFLHITQAIMSVNNLVNF